VIGVHFAVIIMATMWQYEEYRQMGSDEAAFASALGVFATMNMWLTLLFPAKSSVLMTLTGVPHARAIAFHKVIYSLTHPPTHPLTHSLTHPLTHPPTHPLTFLPTATPQRHPPPQTTPPSHAYTHHRPLRSRLW
jgi:hypothetical protein